MRSDSTPSLVYGLTSMVAVVTIESMGVTPPCTLVIQNVSRICYLGIIYFCNRKKLDSYQIYYLYTDPMYPEASLGTRPFAVRRNGLGTCVHSSCPQDGVLT